MSDRCQFGRNHLTHDHEPGALCTQRAERESMYCPAHKAAAMSRVATVQGGDRVRPWAEHGYWLSGRGSD